MNAVRNETAIDEVIFVGFDVPRTNPIWGSFTKWTQRPSVYASSITVVEIKYAQHLSDVERRFVVAKELCHAMDGWEGSHSVTNKSVERLVAGFSLLSTEQPLGAGLGRPMHAELLAEAVAAELICPCAIRKAAVENLTCNDEHRLELALQYGIPEYYSSIAFDPKYISMVESILSTEM